MIDYYFQSNVEDAEKVFKEAGYTLTGVFKSYVDDLLDYLAHEYNTPFNYFLGCADATEIYAAFTDGVPVHELVDVAMMNDNRNGINLIIYGDKKVTP